MIPLVDLSLEKAVERSLVQAFRSVVKSKSYILGNKVESFEKKFAKFTKSKYAVSVGSGTDALRLSLRASGLGKGDKVLVPTLTSSFTVIAIVEEGAVPVFCDVDEKTFNVDPRDAETRIDKKTRAIIPVHLFGNPCSMDKIVRLAKKYDLSVIEDCSQAHGAKFKNRFVGTLGNTGVFSFYPTKNLGALGDGGIVITNDKKLAKSVRLLRNGGQTKRFWHEYKGINSRLDELQAAILEVKLKYLNRDNEKRQNLAKKYLRSFKGLPLKFQEQNANAESVYHLFVVQTKKRDSLRKFLGKSGVMTDIYYPYPIHKQQAFKQFASTSLPVSEKLAQVLLAIPIGPNLKAKDQTYIIRKVKQFFGQGR